jgi:hypothetical protein
VDPDADADAIADAGGAADVDVAGAERARDARTKIAKNATIGTRKAKRNRRQGFVMMDSTFYSSLVMSGNQDVDVRKRAIVSDGKNGQIVR